MLCRERDEFGESSLSAMLSRMKRQFSGPDQTPSKHRPDLRFVNDDDELIDEDSINAKIDPILDKIGKDGMKSLTMQERRILERAREKLKNR